jgi:hypothetical protein
MPRPSSLAWISVATLLSACGDGEPAGPEPPLPVDCSIAYIVTLAPGQHAVVDPRLAGSCLHFPDPGGVEAEYAVAAVSGAGVVTTTGVSESFLLQTAAGGALPAVEGQAIDLAAGARLSAFRRQDPAAEFHHRLRRMEALAAGSASATLGQPQVAYRGPPPELGHQRTFKVCSNTSCSSTTNVPSTAVYVGTRGAIYLDDDVPANGFTPADIAEVGQLFDGASPNMYGIDTVAFGRESDIDGNGVVVILLTDAVNDLSPNCNFTGSRVVGYFYGLDLLPASGSTSNGAEVFFSAVADPANPNCSVSTGTALRTLGPTFVHEFQHMISFNQHRLIRGNLQPELTWLNEGLSHFAEELGGRQLPNNGIALGDAPDRFTQFHVNNFANGYDYLVSTEDHFLITPDASTGTLEERGANWLFVRWLADQFGGGGNGTSFTRAIVQTGRVGQDNVEHVTGEPFDRLVSQWQLANYLDDLPGFTPSTTRLRYTSWDMRDAYADWHASRPSTFPLTFPLQPDETGGGSYSRSGVLRGGSGTHLLLTQPPGSGVTQLTLTSPGGNALSTAIVPRLAVARIR